jgi:hypothetical protein
MTDHHDFGDHHDDFSSDDFHHSADNLPAFDEVPDHFDHFEDFGHHEVPALEDHHTETAPADDIHAATDDHHDDLTTYDDPVFPPPVDVGDLPEPVDGFPWIDTASLGAPDLAAHTTVEPVDPHELAEYAGAEIPPGADPWTVLADSDDPATSTLARFWNNPAE